MTAKHDEVIEAVQAGLDRWPDNARRAVIAVIDLHHDYDGHCYECSRRISTAGKWPRGAIAFPCSTVEAIRSIAVGEQ